jgi:hypothetical protein
VWNAFSANTNMPGREHAKQGGEGRKRVGSIEFKIGSNKTMAKSVCMSVKDFSVFRTHSVMPEREREFFETRKTK